MDTHAFKYILEVNQYGVDVAILGNPELCACFLQIILSRGVTAFGAAPLACSNAADQ